MPVAHPFANELYITLGKLAEEPCLLLEEGGLVNHWKRLDRLVWSPRVLTRKIGLIMKDKNTMPLAAKYFIDFLLAYVEELP